MASICGAYCALRGSLLRTITESGKTRQNAGWQTQLQIGELTKQKKEREKPKMQAPVAATTLETKPETTSEMKVQTTVTQAPVFTAPMVPPQAQSLPAYSPAHLSRCLPNRFHQSMYMLSLKETPVARL